MNIIFPENEISSTDKELLFLWEEEVYPCKETNILRKESCNLCHERVIPCEERFILREERVILWEENLFQREENHFQREEFPFLSFENGSHPLKNYLSIQ